MSNEWMVAELTEDEIKALDDVTCCQDGEHAGMGDEDGFVDAAEVEVKSEVQSDAPLGDSLLGVASFEGDDAGEE